MKVSEHNMIYEWDWEKNFENPNKLTCGSNKIVYWKCLKDPRHCWPALISNRTKGKGCPYCSGRKILPEESFGALCSDKLMMEWDDELNPFNFSQHSHQIINWKCSKNPAHEWPATIGNRTCGTNCPRCSRNISKCEDLWFNSLNNPNVIRNKPLVVGDVIKFPDGYDPNTNTIYEFYGKYWHGDPRYYKSDDYNKTTNCTHGELYKKTMEKEKFYKQAGFKVISIWEDDFKGGSNGRKDNGRKS
jgi:hypothetical protein